MKIQFLYIAPIAIALSLGTACTQSQQDKAQNSAEKTADQTKDAANNAVDKTKDAAKEAGQAISEAGLTGKVKSKLAADVRLSTLTSINVDSNGSTVTLTGHVPTDKDKDAAERVAKSVDGVAKVKNDLTVAP